MPGLGTSFGRGGATTFARDLRHSDAILIMGSNMAECHPVAFRWVMQARTRSDHPCTLIHADPRFTRTSAMCQLYAPLRAGTDIVFLGGLIRYVLERHDPLFGRNATERSPRERFFHDYLVHYTNAASLISEDFRDTEDGDGSGLFSGFDAERQRYDSKSWRYETAPPTAATAAAPAKVGDPTPASFATQVAQLVGPPAKTDPTLRHERCVWQILRRHFARYTPEMVADVCGTPRETFLQVAEALLSNSGPEHTSAVCYAVGWTQHTTGVQMIRAAAILQLLLGNIGRPGGGILALRGHATIQGSTDIATLYNLLPGYLPAPSALRSHDTLADYIRSETSATSFWSNFPRYIVSQLKAWYGEAATAANDFGFQFLPKIVGDHSHMPLFIEMNKGTIRGLMAMGQNPAVGGQNASLQRRALAKLDWLVVRDLFETETASFWKDSPEVRDGILRTEDIATEVFFLPSTAAPENDGSFTNTSRLIQWHNKAADPPGDARSDLWFTFHLGRKLKILYKDSREPQDHPIQALVWDYIDPEENEPWAIKDEPSAQRVMKEINGYVWDTKKPIQGFGDLRDDGTTACGAWIYSGIYAPTSEHPEGHNRAANRQGDDWVSLGWGFAWPANRRILYNRAAADLKGQPWAKEARLAQRYGGSGYVLWDPARKQWVGLDVPDFPGAKSPGMVAKPGSVGLDSHSGDSPFIMKADGKGWLYAPSGLVDGPLPTHYEPCESPVPNAVYREQFNPVALRWPIAGNVLAPVGSPDYPHVLSTYRLTEHHLSGSMSRWLPWLAELQPELFCEISPEHAEELGVQNTNWVEISTPRATIRAKALVTRRIRPYRLKNKTVHHVGLPWHWGYKGISVGDVVNDLSALVGDPNVSIHEAKVFLCQVRKA